MNESRNKCIKEHPASPPGDVTSASFCSLARTTPLPAPFWWQHWLSWGCPFSPSAYNPSRTFGHSIDKLAGVWGIPPGEDCFPRTPVAAQPPAQVCGPLQPRATSPFPTPLHSRPYTSQSRSPPFSPTMALDSPILDRGLAIPRILSPSLGHP